MNTMPLHLRAFVLSNSKGIMNNFIVAIDGFYKNDVFYSETDSLYIELKVSEKLDKAELVGKNRLQGKNDYKEGGVWYDFLLAPNKSFRWSINKFVFTDEHKTFKSLTNVSDTLDRREFLKKAYGGKLIDKVPLSLKNLLVKLL